MKLVVGGRHRRRRGWILFGKRPTGGRNRDLVQPTICGISSPATSVNRMFRPLEKYVSRL